MKARLDLKVMTTLQNASFAALLQRKRLNLQLLVASITYLMKASIAYWLFCSSVPTLRNLTVFSPDKEAFLKTYEEGTFAELQASSADVAST